METAISPPSVQAMQSPAAPQQPSQAASPPLMGFANASLYVGDLDPSVGEGQLFDLFNQIAPVSSIRVCRDQTRRASLGYGYVNYSNAQDAANAKEILNFTHINGKPIRIMFSRRDPSIRKSGFANVFIKNLDPSIDNKALYDTFSVIGTVNSCKVALDSNGRSKGYGFVQFDQEEAAHSAIKQLNGMLLNDKQAYVGLFVRRQDRDRGNGSPKFSNVYVKNFSETTTDDELRNIFAKYGPITSAVIMKDANGRSRCFGFVNFESPESAAAAVENLNGTTVDGDRVLFVGRAQRKSEREAELRAKFEQERSSRFEKLQGSNLYLKNLDDSINDEKLKELFSDFGTITSCKVMVDDQGVSKGSGFVAFSNQDEATRALTEMNGKMIGRKPLYVAVAQRKEERKARLQARFAQFRAGGLPTPLPSGMPAFHGGPPRIAHQQFYYGQGAPGLIPPQPTGYGFQQQLLPGIRPSVPPNFIMPYHLQRQGQQRMGAMGARRGGNAHQMQQQQLLHRNSNQGFRHVANSRNGVDPSMVQQGLIGPMIPMAYDASGMPVNPMDIQQTRPLPMSTLASALASATPEKQRLMLGEELFPLVEQIERENVGKVTGMLLEMDQTEVLHLIESPDALKKKVAEAMEVLRLATAPGSDITNQMGSVSVNE